MELEYDRKFEEMKKYIPFLESMIKRLESTNNGVKNPRKAQLDKIRSLRDLLMDKKKRMKMENLLKCEQVLVNLYAKVEQRESMADNKEDGPEQIVKETSELNVVRNKLKSVVSKLQEEDPETLPEIARASNTEVVCTPGSKEPALFQRRPNKVSPQRLSPSSRKDVNTCSSKRHYTRVLLSPERKKKEWPTNSDTNAEKPLFSRRSPRRSPRRYSPSYKKERKKSSRQRSKSNQHSKDFNITLNVPEERLRSLNTKDILSRIIHCNDNDVDIDTLRGLRSQILGELKQTGSKDDISDLILKSYKKTDTPSKKKDEVEEGELSDSESEAIENIYGSLVVLNEDTSNSNSNITSNDKKQPKKIQICLVINSDKEKDKKIDDHKLSTTIDVTDFEDYTEKKTSNNTTSQKTNDYIIGEISGKEVNKQENKPVEKLKIKSPQKAAEEKYKTLQKSPSKTEITKSLEEKMQSVSRDKPIISSNETFQPNFYQPIIEEKTDQMVENQNSCKFKHEEIDCEKTETTSRLKRKEKNSTASDSSVNIPVKKVAVSEIDILQALKNEILGETPLETVPETITPPLHQPKITKVASALEIAPKKRISIEKYKQKSVLSVKEPLFNPSKQHSSSKDENLKKQSLKLTEKECERFNFPVDVSPVDSSDDEERSSIDVDFPRRDSERNSIIETQKQSIDLGFSLGNSAPKSPDHEDFADTGIKPPVIIPSDPVKNVVATLKTDIDMRTLIPSASPVEGKSHMALPSITGEKVVEGTWKEKTNINNETFRKAVTESWTRMESHQPMPNDSSDTCVDNSDKISRSSVSYQNVTSSISSNTTSKMPALMSLTIPQMISSVNQILSPLLNTKIPLLLNPNMASNMVSNIMPNMKTGLAPNIMNSNMTPSRMVTNVNPLMTPILTPNARSYEMTPRPNFDEEYPNQKHVYAPIIPAFEPHDFTEKDNMNTQRSIHNNRNDRHKDSRLDSPHTRLESPSTPNPSFGRMECPSTPNSSFGRMESPSTPNPSFGRMECPSTPNASFGRKECPSTPNPSFGRMECPSTPNPSFGRMECPTTPNPSFGRIECPPTPNPSFGRMECPPTPNPSFGRSEGPSTPNPSFGRMEPSITSAHAFGRSDCSMKPSHSFGRSDSGRTPTNAFGRNDYHHNVSGSHKYLNYQDPRLNRSSDYDKYHGRTDDRHRTYFDDDRSTADNSNKYRRNHAKFYEQRCRKSRDIMTSRRESSVGRSLSRDNDNDESYSNEYYGNDYHYRRERYRNSDDLHRRRDYNEKGIGRRNLPEDTFSMQTERGTSYTREEKIEKPISVQSHTGRSFNIDTSFNRTFQDTEASSIHTFDERRKRASSVGRSLRDSNCEDLKHTSINNAKCELDLPDFKTIQFRRASSVGRDLRDNNTKKNFNDIKEDLRSCKFNNYDFKLRDQDLKSNEKPSYENERSNDNCRSTDVPIASSKFIVHPSKQDPSRRMRINDEICNKFHDNTKYSPRKNIRDPRMRREVDDKTISKDKYKNKDRYFSSSRNKTYGIVYSNDNIAKGTILASATGVKNFKIPKIKRPVEENDVGSKSEPSKNDTKKDMSFKNAKKEDMANDISNKREYKIKPGTVCVENQRTLENSKENATIINKSKCKEILPSSNKSDTSDKGKSHLDNNLVDSVSDGCDRYITRSMSSSIKSGTTSKYISNTSLTRKSRRFKKPVIYDSDSDSQENEINNANNNKTEEHSKNIETTDNAEIKQKLVDNDETIQKSDNYKHKQQLENSINSSELSNEKTTLDKNENTKLSLRNELSEEQNDLEMSFGVDDEIFSDNTASESVLDNINALIAGLDHDIEAPKINDFNEKFIDNIVGSISSIDSVSTNGNKPADAADIMLNDKSEYSMVKVSNMKIPIQKNNPDVIEVGKVKSNSEIINVPSEKAEDVQNEINDTNDDKGIKSATTIRENIDDTDIQENTSKTFNNDAIDSTTADDQKIDETSVFSHSSLVNSDLSNYSFVPDSTIYSHENDLITTKKKLVQTETSSDSTNNRLISEMNNHVTSTNNSVDMTFKEQSSSNSNVTDDMPRIDSIGKLLSILEDKNKIKELLTMLGKDSGDNEKIKKKLEKLSEIVSDDDEISEENNKDKDINEEIMKKSKEQEIDSVSNKIQQLDENKKLVDTNILDKALQDVELPINQPLLQEVTAINMEEKDLSKNVSKDLSGNGSLLSSKELGEKETVENINKDVFINETGESNSGKEKNEVKEINYFDDVQENKKEDFIEQVPELTEKENHDADSKSVHHKTKNKVVKKSKITKRGRSKLAKKLFLNKEKRVTRSEAGCSQPQIPPVVKKPSRELLKLQEDIRDMFISQDILNATGIRMCRLAKLGNDKHPKGDTQTSEVEPAEPIVVLEKIHNKMSSDGSLNALKKRGSKSKPLTHNEASADFESKGKPKYKPGPKSKTKKQEDDPFSFETDSIAESSKTVDSKDQTLDSDSESASTKSFGSSELLVEAKKTTVKKRKRGSWQLGVIKKKGGKNKSAMKDIEPYMPNSEKVEAHELKWPNLNCFTDKSYCFDKNIKIYLCRLCGYRGYDIVPHFKKHHPHSEIPLSRLNPVTAKEAIEQCENMNLQAVSKIHTKKYICRFCFQEFRKLNTALETFFWHVVSVHTGEYKKLCSECINVTRCPFHLDIPPPPKNLKGQLIGYICGRCNFTQVSLENLKTHVIVRHDDEQTEVYSINLGEIPSKLLQSLLTKANESSIELPRVLRSTRSNQSVTEASDDCSDITDATDQIAKMEMARDNVIQEVTESASPKISALNKIQSKLIFENDDLSDVSNYSRNDEVIQANIKLERDDDDENSVHDITTESTVELIPETETAQRLEPEPTPEPKQKPAIGPEHSNIDRDENIVTEIESRPTDVFEYPHFKIKVSNTGTKEYVCCINGHNHYRTTLLISFKKHVQLKHPENWDGYCFVCKVIIIAQGKHKFKDCLQHFLDKHIDNFPILEETPQPTVKDVPGATTTPVEDIPVSKQYVSVRPLSDLVSAEQSKTDAINSSMPKIHSVMSLGASTDSVNHEPKEVVKMCNYEEAQAEVMTKKHRIVLEAMLTPEKLIQVFKCASRFCSYSTDNAEEALLHASTHQKIGGDNSLRCAYCDFDSSGNAIDLVMHVFKNYSHCPYACSRCFYRAAGSQLVYAHIKRVHKEVEADKVPVLSSGALPKESTKDDLLTRDAAVLYYVCNNRDPEDRTVCQFKSYVLTKFREHLQMKHAGDEEYSCFICNVTTPSSKLLAQHLKSHGLKIYQCCRCLYGADNEADLTAHASEKHPFKQPKAYLRIITTKGASEVRVLPLAVLSKSTVTATVIKPSLNGESPIKQAERSIDLEKLIGHTNLMIKSISTITNAATIKPVDGLAHESQEHVQGEQASCSTSLSESGHTSPATLTLLKDTEVEAIEPNSAVNSVSNKTQNTEIDKEKQPPSLVGVDPVASATVVLDNDVVCLDSDEESSRQNIIDLSGDDTPEVINSTSQQDVGSCIKLPRSRLYKCYKCSVLCKGEGMFKRHINFCFPNTKKLTKCAYCSYVTNANKMVIHYNKSHLESKLRYTCAICKGKFVTLVVAKKHMKLIHNEPSSVVTTKKAADGALQYVLDKNIKERQQPKRKLSGDNSSKTVEPPPKLKKFGPHDIDKLPINPILDNFVFCALCEFSTKVRINMVRHLQMHAAQQPVPRTAPVNPVPHLESNEKYFDRMVNLASSSIEQTHLSKSAKDGNFITTESLSPEAAAIFPKYVSDRLRYTCGAKDCAYISVNESIFKIHWETLHSGTTDYHCVHCPPHQSLDTSKPLSAVRIISHLKMHDANLYACSSCTFYHFTRKLMEKHLKEVHSGKLVIVREQGTSVLLTPPPPPTPSASAPTMDLKPWQCGLCKFKSMLCPEVIEHCGKFHQSKMQFKCTYCGFRTSNIANISKHQSKQHPGKKEEVFYFYYREGSIPDEPDGTALWQKQSQKNEPEIKTEIDVSPTVVASPVPTPPPKPLTTVNLDIVKKEPEVHLQTQESIEELCQEFGQFGEPNGLNYKCSLCKVVIEDTKEAMQSHLYEELQCRKWGCSVCSYKAFHKPGLQMHVQTEHAHSREAREPIELPVDPRIENWVAGFIEHQTTIIERNKENLAKQKAEILRANPGATAKVVEKPVEPTPTTPSKSSGETSNVTMASLEKLFGPFGVPNNMNYSCPKCNTTARSEAVMQEHLEAELNKIRWYCNSCGDSFQTYHEAQFHCRSVHQGQSSRPMEVTRNVGLRNAWVAAALRVQKLSMNYMPVTETPPVETLAQPSDSAPENSLLVVRYEEKVPTPEELMKLNKKPTGEDDKANKATPSSEEADNKTLPESFQCQYCTASYKYENFYQTHVLKHYGLKPYTCPYCPLTYHKKSMESHIINAHPNRSVLFMSTQIPNQPPASATNSAAQTPESEAKIICLVCEHEMTTMSSQSHFHDGVRPQFAIKGSVVYKCSSCFTLYKTGIDYNQHCKQFHSKEKKTAAFYKFCDNGRPLYCNQCNVSFPKLAEYRAHQQQAHNLKPPSAQPEPGDVIELDNELDTVRKRKAEDGTILPVAKRVAKKSTTKLPHVMAVARKSTTKLPYDAPSDEEECSYYGTKPSMDNLENVTTLMPFCNTLVPFTLNKLNDIINIYPIVVVKDITNKK